MSWQTGGHIHRLIDKINATIRLVKSLMHTNATSASRLDTIYLAEDTKDSRSAKSNEDWLIHELKPSEFSDDIGILGNYRLIRRIGQGGMAYVFEAIDLHLQRRVAVKVLKLGQLESSPETDSWQKRDRLRLSAIRMVVGVYGISATEEMQPYIAMEFMEGGCLQSRIASKQAIGARLRPVGFLKLQTAFQQHIKQA